MTKRRKMGTGRVAAKTRRPTPREARALRSSAEKKKIALLRRELSEALEQQTATSEVLQVISSSPRDLKPVFETILANPTRICAAKLGTLYLHDGAASPPHRSPTPPPPPSAPPHHPPH